MLLVFLFSLTNSFPAVRVNPMASGGTATDADPSAPGRRQRLRLLSALGGRGARGAAGRKWLGNLGDGNGV